MRPEHAHAEESDRRALTPEQVLSQALTSQRGVQPSLDSLIAYRGPSETDIGFIRRSWLKTLQPSVSKLVPTDVFFAKHDRLIGDIARCADCWVLCDREHTFYIYGWIVGSIVPTTGDIVLHYVYIRPEWRGRGFAAQLLTKLGWDGRRKVIVTQEPTEFIKQKRLEKKFSILYDPYLLYTLFNRIKV